MRHSNLWSYISAVVFFLFISWSARAQEICDNDLDDDTDGLIDCYDPDCSGNELCKDQFYGHPTPECQYFPPVGPNFGLERVWESPMIFETRKTLTVGDIDNDGVPEVVYLFASNAFGCTSVADGIYVVNGATGEVENSSTGVSISVLNDSPAIGDIDGDGTWEIFFVDCQRNLRRYEHDLTQTWVSTEIVGYDDGDNEMGNQWSPSLADFDGDGNVEVYLGSQIFDANTGELLFRQGYNSSHGLEFSTGVGGGGDKDLAAYSFAADVLPDDYCPDCAGLELVAGNAVYAINIATSTMFLVTNSPTYLTDGFTSVADINADGLLDVVTIGRELGEGLMAVSAWDPRTGLLIRPVYTRPDIALGQASIADFDNDGEVEVGFAGLHMVYVVDNDFSLLWEEEIFDVSAKTTFSAFDFEGDGIVEIVYRDEKNLFVLDGKTGAQRAITPCTSGTRTEFPTIADVNGDGEANILCACGDPANSNPTFSAGPAVLFTSNTNVWVSARQVMNQHQYNVTNVNDDGTIPKAAGVQNTAAIPKINGFLTQSPLRDVKGDPLFKAADVNLELVEYTETATEATVKLKVCNLSKDKVAPTGTILSFYSGNPKTVGTRMTTRTINQPIDTGACLEFTYTIPIVPCELHIYVNDNGSTPSTAPNFAYGECDFANNNVFYIQPNFGVSLTEDVISCAGAADGKVTAVVSSGTPPFTYTWSKAGTPATQDFIDQLGPGVYAVSIEDQQSCKADATIEIGQPSALTSTVASTDVKCAGANDGTGTVSPTGGTEPYTFLWSDGQTTTQAIDLAPGNYSVEIKDKNDCAISKDIAITEPTAIELVSINSTDPNCFGDKDGTGSIAVTGGTEPLIYSWSNGKQKASISGLKAGKYSVTVRDANQCTYVDSVELTDPSGIVLTTSSEPSLCRQPNGKASVEAIGGAGDYAYKWTENNTPNIVLSNTFELHDVTPGFYKVEVTDAKECGVEAIERVQNDIGAKFRISRTTNATCKGTATGTAEISLESGNGNFEYLWPEQVGSVTEPVHNALIAGRWRVTVTNQDNGCKEFILVVIEEPEGMELETVALQNDFCGQGIGSGSVKVNGGTYPYRFAWSNSESDSVATSLSGGINTVTVTDKNNCTAQAEVVIGDENAATIDAVQTNLSCFEACDGAVSITMKGGETPFSYAWTGTDCSGPSCANLCAGVYTVEVTDGQGCKSAQEFTITEPDELIVELSTVNVRCFGEENGSIEAQVAGGTVVNDYKYRWSDGQRRAIADDLSAGDYDITVTDNNKCEVIVAQTVTEPNDYTVDFEFDNALCAGDSNGRILTTVAGATPSLESGYQYLWTTGSTESNLSNLPKGNYGVTITDSVGCSFIANNLSISEPNALGLSLTSITTSCPTSTDGGATSRINGGTTPYKSYAWSSNPIQNTPDLVNVAAGSYTLTVADNNGCTITEEVEIVNAIEMVLTTSVLNEVSCFNGGDGRAEVQVQNGATPHTYRWQDAIGNDLQAGSLLTNVPAGNYGIEVTDNNGCIVADNITITEPTELVVETTHQDINCFGDATGSASVMANGGTPGYSYAWNTIPAQTTEEAINLSAGTYQVEVTDQNGCITLGNVLISQPQLALHAGKFSFHTNPDCKGASTGSIFIEMLGGTGAFSYNWVNINAPDDPTVEDLSAGSYAVIVTDELGCTFDTTYILIEPSEVTIVAQEQLPCYQDENGSLKVAANGGTPGYSYQWALGSNEATMDGLARNDEGYALEVRDANDCVFNFDVPLSEHDEIIIDVPTEYIIEEGQTITFEPSASPGSEYFYAWIPDYALYDQQDGGVLTVRPLVDTTYIVTALDINTGCSNELAVNVFVNPFIVITIPNSFTPDGDGKDDKFEIPANDEYEVLWFKVYDRWGTLVFMGSSWDGKVGGEVAPMGSYAVQYEYRIFETNEQSIGRSSLLLLK